MSVIIEPEEEDVGALRIQVERLSNDNRKLLATVEDLRGKMAIINPEPINETYTLDQFMVAIAARRGRTYGWKIDYAQATANTPGSHPVTTDEIGKWQKDQRVPIWAYAQIEWLQFPKRIGRQRPEWTDDNIDFLVELCLSDPRQSNNRLAAKCSEHFDREITPNSIKGQLFRLGQIGRLPEHRPPRQRLTTEG